jgi:Gpi18-like mannosyltransferase
LSARLALVLVAIAVRTPDLLRFGEMQDMVSSYAPWGQSIRTLGLFGIYAHERGADLPPVFMVLLSVSSMPFPALMDNFVTLPFTTLTKLFPVLAETLLVLIASAWRSVSPRLPLGLAAGIALNPGLIATSAFWGQLDAIMTFLLTLSILAVSRGQYRASWLWYTAAILMKFQAVILLPLLVILTIKRAGLLTLSRCLLLALLLFSIVYAPFLYFSGIQASFRPYLEAVGLYPVTTANAFNLWYILTPNVWFRLPLLLNDIPLDSSSFVLSLSAKGLGILLLSVFFLVVLLLAYRSARMSTEFAWSAALYVGFFFFPTEIHERYLYPAVVLAIFACAQNRSFIPIAIGLTLVYTLNIVSVATVDYTWLGLNLKDILRSIAALTGTTLSVAIGFGAFLAAFIVAGCILWTVRLLTPAKLQPGNT